MGNTLKIRKSKYLSYQKQGFLYLVFILFLFFSQAGEYVMHYISLANTQKELNTYLENRLSSLVLENEADDQYRQQVLARVGTLEEITASFEEYEQQSIAGLDQFRENQFAERRVRRGELGATFDNLWIEQQEQSEGRWTEKLLVDYDNRYFSATNFFFKETPNAVVPSLVEHAKTAFLVEALEDLNKQALVFEKYTMERLEEANFTSVFKKRLFLGEDFNLTILSEEVEDSVEIVTVNSKPQTLNRQDRETELSYRPNTWGKYFVEIQTRSQRFYTSFEVVRPRIRFVAQQDLIDLTLGKEQSISIDKNYMPSKDFMFESEYAFTSYTDGLLRVRPTTIGEFTLRLIVGGEAVDSVTLGARAPELLEVSLANAAGAPSTISEAHRVQSNNPNFQVLSYTALYYPKDGSKAKTYTSLSRLLSAQVAQWAQAPGTLVIKDIALLSSNGTTKIFAQPLIISVNE